jgi:hypothetical protein
MHTSHLAMIVADAHSRQLRRAAEVRRAVQPRVNR